MREFFRVRIATNTIAAMAQRTAERFETFTEHLTGVLCSTGFHRHRK